MPETTSTRRIIGRALGVGLGLAFLIIGAAKLSGSLHTVQTFAAFGWGQWFRYVAGLLDLIGAVLVLAPRWTYHGAVLLACTVGLAAVLSLTRPFDLLAALALTLLAASVAWLTRPASSRATTPGHTDWSTTARHFS